MRRSWLPVVVLVTAVLGLAAAGLAAETTLRPAPEGSFSFVVIPDTQQYHGRGTKAEPESTEPVTNAVLATHIKWILAQQQSQRIAFVSHVGDIVDRNTPEQWEVARDCLAPLHGRLPYGLALGNHDVKASGDSSLFARYFPAERFRDFAWYGGYYAGNPRYGTSGNNANSFQLISAGGMDFVWLHLECNAPDDVLQWAADVLRRHVDRRGVVTTHMGLGPLEKPKQVGDFMSAPRGRMCWKKVHGERGNTPQQMWDKCFRKADNLFLIFYGDQSRAQAMHRVSTNDAGRKVFELLSDYGGWWLRVNRFLPAQRRIEVFAVDSRDGTLCSGTQRQPDPGQHQFALTY